MGFPPSTGNMVVVAQKYVNQGHTGDTNETILATIPIPASLLGANGRIYVSTEWSRNAAGVGTVTTRHRFGLSGSGLSGTALAVAGITTAGQSATIFAEIVNANATNSQIGVLNSYGHGQTANAIATAAIATTSATEVNITGVCANAADTITLLAYQVLVYPHS